MLFPDPRAEFESESRVLEIDVRGLCRRRFGSAIRICWDRAGLCAGLFAGLDLLP